MCIWSLPLTLFALLAKWKLLSESDWNLYQFVRHKPKTILLNIIVISLVPEIEEKGREEGEKCLTLRSPDKSRSQDSPLSPPSESSPTWPFKQEKNPSFVGLLPLCIMFSLELHCGSNCTQFSQENIIDPPQNRLELSDSRAAQC